MVPGYLGCPGSTSEIVGWIGEGVGVTVSGELALSYSTLYQMLSSWYLPPTKGGTNMHILLLVSMFHRGVSLPQLPSQPTSNLGTNFPSSKYVHPRGISRCTSPPFWVFWHYIFCQSFGTKIGKYSIFPQTWRSIVSVDIAKVVWIFFSLFQFCFAIWINYIIIQQNEKSTLRYIHFESWKQLEKKTGKEPLMAGSDLIQMSSVVRYLGWFLNKSLTFNNHIN